MSYPIGLLLLLEALRGAPQAPVPPMTPPAISCEEGRRLDIQSGGLFPRQVIRGRNLGEVIYEYKSGEMINAKCEPIDELGEPK